MKPFGSRVGPGVWRGVHAALFDDLDFQKLSPNARLVLLVARLGSQQTIASIFRYYPEVLQAQTGLALLNLEAALRELESKPTKARPWILRDPQVLWVRNGLRHDPTVTLENPNHLTAVLRALTALPRTSQVVRKFKSYYGLAGKSHPPSHGVSHPPSHGRSGLPIPTPTLNPIAKQILPGIAHSPENPGNDNGHVNPEPACNENGNNRTLPYQALLEEIRDKHPDWTPQQVSDAGIREVERLTAARGRA